MRRALPQLLLCLTAVAVYQDSLSAPFIFDDLSSIPENPQIRRLWPPWKTWDVPRDLTVSGRPLVSLTLAVNYAIGGLRVEGYHATSILLHILCSLALLGVLLSVLSCGLGMASKELMVTCPVIVLLYDRVFCARSFSGLLRRRWGYYAGLAAALALLALLIASRPRAHSAGFGFATCTPLDYATTQLRVVTHYLRLLFWPSPLIIDHGDCHARDLYPHLALSAALIAALVVGTGFALLRRPRIGFAGAWFFGILAPVSTVMPIASEIAAERRIYLPLAAPLTLLVLAGGWLLSRGSRRLGWSRPVAAAVGGALVGALTIGLGLLAHRRTTDYATAVSIWRDVAEKKPNNPRARLNLSSSLLAAGRSEEAIERLGPLLPH